MGVPPFFLAAVASGSFVVYRDRLQKFGLPGQLWYQHISIEVYGYGRHYS